jgi:hypothetical protein
MGPTPLKLAAVVAFVLVAGVVAAVNYRQILNPNKPALPQDQSDCASFDSQAELRRDPSDPSGLGGPIGTASDGTSGVACEVYPFDDPARDESPVGAAGSPPSTTITTPPPITGPPPRTPPTTDASPPSSAPASRNPEPPRDLFNAGRPSNRPVSLMPDRDCPVEFPVEQNGRCYSRKSSSVASSLDKSTLYPQTIYVFWFRVVFDLFSDVVFSGTKRGGSYPVPLVQSIEI